MNSPGTPGGAPHRAALLAAATEVPALRATLSLVELPTLLGCQNERRARQSVDARNGQIT